MRRSKPEPAYAFTPALIYFYDRGFGNDVFPDAEAAGDGEAEIAGAFLLEGVGHYGVHLGDEADVSDTQEIPVIGIPCCKLTIGHIFWPETVVFAIISEHGIANTNADRD